VFSVNNKKMFKKKDFFYFLHKSVLNRTRIFKAKNKIYKFEMFTVLLSEYNSFQIFKLILIF
jgi:hypothetical protein